MENSVNTQATNSETQENNKLIAEFMGYELDTQENLYWIDDNIIGKYGFAPDELVFNTDWNWLMQVVEKIENLQYQNDNDCFKVVIDYGTCIIYNIINAFEVVIDTTKGTKKEAVYTAVISFINWYNANK